MKKLKTTYRVSDSMKRLPQAHKPTIETIINTAAIALTATGTTWILTKDSWGFLLVVFGLALEWFKYYGRDKWW